MKSISRSDLFAILCIFLFSIYAGVTIASIPFHPDESTQIFMSSDVEHFLESPSSLFWTPDQSAELRQKYHLLDSPIPRYLIGIARQITQQPALPSDWDWSKSWLENQDQGALPNPILLKTARLAMFFLFPGTLYFSYKIGQSSKGNFLGWCLLILTATNALILLHTRRAMAEGPLLFGVYFSLWAFLKWQKKSWLTAVPIAFAFNAKYSTIPLILLGFSWIGWICFSNKGKIRQFLFNGLVYGFLILLITFALNPFLWKSPMHAAAAAFHARSELVSNQVNALQSKNADQVLSTPLMRFLGLISHTYFSTPAIEEVGNYTAQTESSKIIYLSNPINHLMRSFIGGSIYFLFTLMGITVGTINILKNGIPKSTPETIFLIGTILETIFILVFVPLPFQRYYLPLLPFYIFWVGYFCNFVITTIGTRNKKALEYLPGR